MSQGLADGEESGDVALRKSPLSSPGKRSDSQTMGQDILAEMVWNGSSELGPVGGGPAFEDSSSSLTYTRGDPLIPERRRREGSFPGCSLLGNVL